MRKKREAAPPSAMTVTAWRSQATLEPLAKKPGQQAMGKTSSKTSLLSRSIFRRGAPLDGGEDRRALQLGNGP